MNKDFLNQNLYKADTGEEEEEETDKNEPTSTLLSQIPEDKLRLMMQSSFEPNNYQLECLASLLPDDLLQRIIAEASEDLLLNGPEVINFEGVILGIQLVGFSDSIQKVIDAMDQISAKKLGFVSAFSKIDCSYNIALVKSSLYIS